MVDCAEIHCYQCKYCKELPSGEIVCSRVVKVEEVASDA